MVLDYILKDMQLIRPLHHYRQEQLLPLQAQAVRWCSVLPRPAQPDQQALSQVRWFRQRPGTDSQRLVTPLPSLDLILTTIRLGHRHQRRLPQHRRPDHQAAQPLQQARQVAADRLLRRQHPVAQALQERRQHHRQARLPL